MLEIGLVVVSMLLGTTVAQITDETQARQFIDRLSKEYEELQIHKGPIAWAFTTGKNNEKEKLKKDYDAENEKFDDFNMKSYDELKKYDWRSFSDPELKRMFFLWSDYGNDLLPPSEKESLIKTEQDMTNVGNIKVNEFNSQGESSEISVQQMIDEISKDFTNAEKATFYWKEWATKAAKPQKDKFTKWIELKTKAAESNGYSTILEYWQSMSEVEDYEATILPLLDEIQPLFTELHAYLRHKLRDIYGDDAISPTGAIPISLIVWDWGIFHDDLMNRLLPVPGKKKWDITPALQAKGIQGRKAVETIDDFFKSIGFDGLSDDVYQTSIFEKPENADCKPATYDFFNKKDYRLTLCSKPTPEDFGDVASNLILLEWRMAYKELTALYKTLNPYLKDSVAFAMLNFINSPKHLKRIELIEQDFEIDNDLEINLLFKESLEFVFKNPFFLAFDMWRWRVIKKEIQPENYNCEFWNLRAQYQGVDAPVERDNTDFDPALYAPISGEELIKSVMMHFMKYDIIWSLCTTADGYHPNTTPENDLMFCDVRDNHEVGEKLKEAMKLGNTQPWNEILEKITGRNRLDATGFNEYYKPLLEWLKKYNKDNNVPTGWPDHTEKCQ